MLGEHGDVLFAVILHICGDAHEFERLVLLPLSMGNPCGCSQHLDFNLLGPIGLVRLFQHGAKFLELAQLAIGSSKVAAARQTHGACEM